jgi:thiol-disulfide isomerase/thioredoxin
MTGLRTDRELRAFFANEGQSPPSNACGDAPLSRALIRLSLAVLTLYLAVRLVQGLMVRPALALSRATAACHGASAKLATVPPPALNPAPIQLQGDAAVLTAVQSPAAVVMLHSPNCTHCRVALPTFVDAARHPTCNLPVYTVDCSSNITRELLKTLGVSGFPTVLQCKSGECTEYKGPRTLKGYLSCMAI